MTEFIEYQLYFNTAEIEAMYFNGDTGPYIETIRSFTLPTGKYRVICGELFRIVDGIPPLLQEQK